MRIDRSSGGHRCVSANETAVHDLGEKSFFTVISYLGGSDGINILGWSANFAIGEANYGLEEIRGMAGRKTGTESEAELVRSLLRDASKKLQGKGITIAEFIKLLQLRREFEGDELKEIEVRWVEPQVTDDAGKR